MSCDGCVTPLGKLSWQSGFAKGGLQFSITHVAPIGVNAPTLQPHYALTSDSVEYVTHRRLVIDRWECR